MTVQKLWNPKWATFTGVLMIEGELQKRTLPITEGHWGSAGTSPGKEANGAPQLLLEKELFGELV